MGDAFSVPFILSWSSVKIWKIVQVPIAILMTKYVQRQRDLNEEFVSFSCELHLHLSRSQWPLGGHGRCNPLPLFYFVFSFSYGVAKLQPCPFSDRYCSPNTSFVGPFFSLLALFLIKSSWQALMILIHAQTSTLTYVSLLWLRYHHRAQWLGLFCLWLHR